MEISQIYQFLLIDSDSETRAALKEFIEDSHRAFRCIEAETSESAMDLLESGKVRSPRLVLLAARATDGPGMQCLKALRSHEKLSSELVFAYGLDDKPVVSECFSYNVAGFFPFPLADSERQGLREFFKKYIQVVELPQYIP